MAAEISREPSSDRAVFTSVLKTRVRSGLTGVSLATDQTTTLARLWPRGADFSVHVRKSLPRRRRILRQPLTTTAWSSNLGAQ